MAVQKNGEHAKKLKNLAKYNKDAAGSYETAAENVGRDEFSTLFRKFQQQHSDFANKLEAHASTLKGEAEEIEESSLGKIFQGWMNLKSSITENDTEAMVEETDRMEEALIDQYEDAMKVDWTPELQQEISEQISTLQQTRNELKQYR